LVAATKALSHSAVNLTNENEDLVKQREALLSQLWLNINSLEKVLFSPQSTVQPVLASTELLASNENLEKLLKILEAMLTEILKFQQIKQEELRYWSSEHRQTFSLFVYFYQNPEQLLRLYSDLKTRVEAGKINS